MQHVYDGAGRIFGGGCCPLFSGRRGLGRDDAAVRGPRPSFDRELGGPYTILSQKSLRRGNSNVSLHILDYRIVRQMLSGIGHIRSVVARQFAGGETGRDGLRRTSHCHKK